MCAVRKEGVLQCGLFADKGRERVLHVRTSKLFVEKTKIFFKNYGVSVRTNVREVEAMRIFLRFCADVFYGRSLTILADEAEWSFSMI